MVGFLVFCFLYKTNPNPRKKKNCRKKCPNATFNLMFLGLGWPWVGEFVGFMIIFVCLPTQHDLVYLSQNTLLLGSRLVPSLRFQCAPAGRVIRTWDRSRSRSPRSYIRRCDIRCCGKSRIIQILTGKHVRKSCVEQIDPTRLNIICVVQIMYT